MSLMKSWRDLSIQALFQSTWFGFGFFSSFPLVWMRFLSGDQGPLSLIFAETGIVYTVLVFGFLVTLLNSGNRWPRLANVIIATPLALLLTALYGYLAVTYVGKAIQWEYQELELIVFAVLVWGTLIFLSKRLGAVKSEKIK